MSNLSERIAECLKESGDTQADFARNSGISTSVINQWITGKNRNMSTDSLLKASSYFKVNQLWLSKGVGKKRKLTTANISDPELDMTLDVNYLAELIAEVDRALFYRGESLPISEKADLIARLYSEHQEINPETIAAALSE